MDELLERFQDAFDLQEKGPPAEMALADAAERRLLLGVLNFPEAVSDSLDLLAVHPPLRPRPALHRVLRALPGVERGGAPERLALC